MSGSHREVRDIVKTADWSKVRFIHSCSTYRLAVLPFTVETIDDILTTSLIAPLLFLPLSPPPTSLLLRLPFLLAIFFSVLLSHFFFTSLLSLFFFVFPSLCLVQVSWDRSANLFNVLYERLLQLLNPKHEPFHESQ